MGERFRMTAVLIAVVSLLGSVCVRTDRGGIEGGKDVEEEASEASDLEMCRHDTLVTMRVRVLARKWKT